MHKENIEELVNPVIAEATENILNTTNEQLKRLETELWGAADNLRANSKLTAAEYKDPVLGLILLRYAQNKFEEAKKQIEKELPINPRTNKKREVT